jgi:hypothetical protein
MSGRVNTTLAVGIAVAFWACFSRVVLRGFCLGFAWRLAKKAVRLRPGGW